MTTIRPSDDDRSPRAEHRGTVRGDIALSDARPTARDVASSVLTRAVLPAVVVFALLVAAGKIIMNVFDELPSEDGISRDVAGWRTSWFNPVSKAVSTANDTWFTIGGAIVVGLIILALTRKWWLGILPVLAITVEASVFVPVTKIVDRPRPEVVRLDPHAPPTSSFPSGHTAASFALFWSLMLLAQRIPNALLRKAIQLVCFVFPFCVGFARLYRGMHHLSDVLFGVGLGIFCAFACHGAIRHAERVAGERAERRA